MSKKIVQLGGGRLMVHSVKKIQELGYEVFVLDKSPDSPAFAVAQGHAVIDIVDAEAVNTYAQKIKADVVLAVNEAGIYSATYANSILGLGGNRPEDVLLFTDKGYMRERWEKDCLPQPAFRVLTDAGKIPDAIKELGLPVILKPCLNWGSRGISLIRTTGDIEWAIDFAVKHCKDNRYIVEKFISGVEMTIEGLVHHGELSVLAKSDKIAQQHDKFRVAMQLNYPANFSAEKLRLTDDIIKKAAASLGIVNGAFHAECMVNDEGVFLIEMAGRPGGGHIFGLIVEAVSGVCMPQKLVQILLNIKTDIQFKFQHGSCYKFFSPPAGKFLSVENTSEARNAKGILDAGFEMLPGTVVGAIAGDPDRPGYIVSEGVDRNDAIANAENAFKIFKFNMEGKS